MNDTTQQLPAEFRGLEHASRQRWARVAAAVMLKTLDGHPDVLKTIVARGEDEFVRVSRSQYSGHGFRTRDLKNIYACLVQEAGKLQVAEARHRG